MSAAPSTEVDVKDGSVTLKGVAANQAQKDLTTEYAKDIDGVKSVENEIDGGDEPAEAPTKPSGEKIDDASITAQVKGSLLSHRSTSMLSTKVSTSEGVVTLGGTANNARRKGSGHQARDGYQWCEERGQ